MSRSAAPSLADPMPRAFRPAAARGVAAVAVPPPRPAPPRRRATGGSRHDGLTASQRRLLVGVIAALHVAAGYGVLQIREVREAVVTSAPLLVSLIAPETPPAPPAPPPPEPPKPTPRLPLPPKPTVQPPKAPTPAPAPLVAAAAEPAPAAFVAPVAAPAPPTPPAQPVEAPAAPVVAAAPPPAPAAAVIPESAIEYLEPLQPVYPRLSTRMNESGRTLVRVFIDEAGRARDIEVNRSSGFARLDAAALDAIRKARFKPPMRNGQAFSGWAFIPIEFSLEK